MWLVAVGAAVAGLGPAGIGFAVASATPATGSGFTLVATTSPPPEVVPGGKLKFSFSVTNGNSATTSPLTVTDSVPAGTALVPGTVSCGTAGGTCSESWTGSTLQWVIPAGTSPGAFFFMSFIVSVTAPNPPQKILSQVAFTGPGCPSAPCTTYVPAVAAASPSAVSAASVGAASGPARDPGIGSLPATGGGRKDTQPITVLVPKCNHDQKKLKCPPGKGNGHGQGNGQGQNQNPKPRSHLVFTGDYQIRNVEVGLLLVATGIFLVVVTRRRARTEAVELP